MDDEKNNAAEQAVFVEMDQADEEQIVGEMRGQFVADWVYSFCKKHGNKCGPECKDRTTGLSWVGTKEAARRIGHIHCAQPVVVDTGDTYRVLVETTNATADLVLWGAAEQPKKMAVHRVDDHGFWIRGKDGEWEYDYVPDPFAYAKAVSKGQRAGIQHVISSKLIAAMITAFLAEGRGVKYISAQSSPVPSREAGRVPMATFRLANSKDWMAKLAQEAPLYLGQGNKPNPVLILATAKNLGYAVITAENADEVFAKLIAQSKSGEAQSEEQEASAPPEVTS